MTFLKELNRVVDSLRIETSGAHKSGMKTRPAGITMPDGTAPTVEWVERTFGVPRQEAERIAARYR